MTQRKCEWWVQVPLMGLVGNHEIEADAQGRKFQAYRQGLPSLLFPDD